ncbi:helix-turn-helix domain-containing protein [Streptomyces sp. NBC_00285]
MRLEAAERFERGDEVKVIAKDLRVTERTVWRWRKVWRKGVITALESKGPVSRERLSVREWDRLEAELERGPLAYGFSDDQRWTLGRIKTLIGRLFHRGYTMLERMLCGQFADARALLNIYGDQCQGVGPCYVNGQGPGERNSNASRGNGVWPLPGQAQRNGRKGLPKTKRMPCHRVRGTL